MKIIVFSSTFLLFIFSANAGYSLRREKNDLIYRGTRSKNHTTPKPDKRRTPKIETTTQ
jgi:hypothetical protein